MIARARSGRTRSVHALLALAILLVVPASAPGSVDAASLSDQIKAAQERQRDLGRSIARQEDIIRGIERDQDSTRAAIDDLRAELAENARDQEAVKRKIEQTIERIKRVEDRHDALVDELRQSDWTLGLLQQELASGQEDLRARRQALGQRLAEAYRAENTTLLEQVLTSESFTDVMTQANAYLALGDQDAQMADDIAQDQQALDALRLVTTSTRLRTDQLRRATIETRKLVEERKAQLKAFQKELQRIERETERRKEAQHAHYDQLVQNEREAQAYRNKLANAQAALRRKVAGLVRAAQLKAQRAFGGPTPADGGGIFRWPAAGTISGNYGCSSFPGYPPGGGCQHFHDGIDIANNPGTPILAAADGFVAYAGQRADGAIVIVIGHGGGLETTYAHLSSIAVGNGAKVRRGQRIGSMGCTGWCTGPHLHWEVRRNGALQNPRAYV